MTSAPRFAVLSAAAGAKVAINDNASKTGAEAIATEITKAGGTAATYQADVADLEQVRRMVDRVKSDFGGLGILVNNAGFVIRKRFAETQPEEWQKQIKRACIARFTAAIRAGPLLEASGHGRIISVIGDLSRVGEFGLADRSGSPRRYGRIDEIACARDGSLRRDLRNALALGLDRDCARQDLGLTRTATSW